LIDADVELCAFLGELLAREGFAVECRHEGNQGLRRALEPDIRLVVLDVMLPGIGGFEILRRLRRRSAVPVIVLTARGVDEDRIEGLELGADDYLAKPCNPRELVARIRAILRRSEPRPGAAVEAGGVTLDPATRQARSGGKPVELTTFEFDILELLMRSAGSVVHRDRLMENFYHRKTTPFDRSIDMHISHLRKKLQGGEGLIKTIRGVGYQFAGAAGSAQVE